jgi:transposase
MTQKIDTRKLSSAELLVLRRQAIRLRAQSSSFQDIAAITGVSSKTVSAWCRAYEKEGEASFTYKKRGRIEGDQRSLTEAQEDRVQREITDKMPGQCKLAFALWTRRAVQQLIKQLWGKDMPIRTVGDYLQRWGFTPQKPLKKAYEQDPKRVDAWLNEQYPQIKERAKQENAEIHWGDETGLRNDSQHGRSYAPKGQTPVQVIPAKRCSMNMISSITNQGKVRFMIYNSTMTAKVLLRFMKQLIKSSNKKVFLILDNLRVHHAKLVKAWLERPENQTRIEVFYLPAYSPELNPDEYLNCDLKAGVHSGDAPKDAETLKKRMSSHMKLLQNRPDRVKSYFQHRSIAYAA